MQNQNGNLNNNNVHYMLPIIRAISSIQELRDFFHFEDIYVEGSQTNIELAKKVKKIQLLSDYFEEAQYNKTENPFIDNNNKIIPPFSSFSTQSVIEIIFIIQSYLYSSFDENDNSIKDLFNFYIESSLCLDCSFISNQEVNFLFEVKANDYPLNSLTTPINLYDSLNWKNKDCKSNDTHRMQFKGSKYFIIKITEVYDEFLSHIIFETVDWIPFMGENIMMNQAYSFHCAFLYGATENNKTDTYFITITHNSNKFIRIFTNNNWHPETIQYDHTLFLNYVEGKQINECLLILKIQNQKKNIQPDSEKSVLDLLIDTDKNKSESQDLDDRYSINSNAPSNKNSFISSSTNKKKKVV